MAFNPADVATSYLSGLDSGQRYRAQGLNIEKMKKEMLAKEQQKQKGEQISGLLGDFVGNKEDRHSIAGELIGLGTEGVQALKAGSTYIAGQDKAATEKATAEETKGAEDLTNAFPYAMNVKDEKEWKTQAFPFVADAFIRSGGDPALIQKLNNMPMAEAQEVMAKMWDEEVTQKSGSFKSYVNKKDPTQSRQVNMSNPEDVSWLAENSDTWIPAPTRQETGGPGEFASGGKSEQKDLNVLATGVNTFIRNIDRAVNTLEVEPASGQIVGDLTLFADNMAQNLTSIARETGVIEEDVASDIAEFSGSIEPIAAATSELNAALIDAAYAKALILNGTRPTDPDFKNAYKTLTGGSQNPKILIRNLKRSSSDMAADFRFRYRQSTGSDWSGKFDIEAGKGKGKYDFKAMNKEDLNALDVNSMSKSELKAAEKRWNELNATG